MLVYQRVSINGCFSWMIETSFTCLENACKSPNDFFSTGSLEISFRNPCLQLLKWGFLDGEKKNLGEKSSQLLLASKAFCRATSTKSLESTYRLKRPNSDGKSCDLNDGIPRFGYI